MNLISYLPQLLHGLSITLILMLVSISIGFLLAVMMTICLMSDHFFIRKTIQGFIFFIRGTPLLVQIFLIYYGTGQFEWIRNSALWIVLQGPMACAIIALSINTAAYTTVLLKGAIDSVPKNEIAACEALGMSKWLALRHVIFPRAFRIALPAYSNEVLMILKGTSLVSTITILDLMGVTQKINAETYATVELYLMVGIIYLVLNGVITTLFKLARTLNHKF